MNKSIINDFVINIATVNGSGSQSANTILLKSLFKMGIPVGGKNVFPSNIAGLPTWFWVRANKENDVGRRKYADILVALNPQSFLEDLRCLRPGGVVLYNADFLIPEKARTDIQLIPIPFKKIVDRATEAVKLKKLLINMVYVGALTEFLGLDPSIVEDCLKLQFENKSSAVDSNLKALALGQAYVRESFPKHEFPFRAEKMQGTAGKLIIDGNTASALGLVFGGCTFASWYPITPSSSVIENFSSFCEQYKKDADGKNNFAVVQAEDELASICMVLGAGWAGCRAMTATSGPGLSLMAEAAGYAYYAEIPSVIWNVQRVGPSTGMPTRTAQGDLLSAVHLSHGDTKHPVLIPGTAKECFEFGQTCFDLAENLQQLVIVLSDLELGMNLWMEDVFEYPQQPLQRGKVLNSEELEKRTSYFRYDDPDGDSIAYRTIPGTRHPRAAYFTRGSGHNSKANYTENSQEYQQLVDRLAKKWSLAKNLVPKPIVTGQAEKVGIIAYGSTDSPINEARKILCQENCATDYLRIRALPLTDELQQFLEKHEVIFVVEQNRDAQMLSLIKMEFPQYYKKLRSALHYDGSPITADFIAEEIQASLSQDRP